jgi:hypothetical protein
VGFFGWTSSAPEFFCLVVGFGGVTAILWEVGKYLAFIRNSPELATAYKDMLGDMARACWHGQRQSVGTEEAPLPCRPVRQGEGPIHQ